LKSPRFRGIWVGPVPWDFAANFAKKEILKGLKQRFSSVGNGLKSTVTAKNLCQRFPIASGTRDSDTLANDPGQCRRFPSNVSDPKTPTECDKYSPKEKKTAKRALKVARATFLPKTELWEIVARATFLSDRER
jgi:hypothetical protein